MVLEVVVVRIGRLDVQDVAKGRYSSSLKAQVAKFGPTGDLPFRVRTPRGCSQVTGPEPASYGGELLPVRPMQAHFFLPCVCSRIVMRPSILVALLALVIREIAREAARGLSGLRRRFFTHRVPLATKLPSRRK